MAAPGTGGAVAIPERLPSEPPLAGDPDYAAFERGEVVGRGGNATVYAASLRDDPERVVALKEPHVADELPDTVVDRFRSEAETWAGLDDHDHVAAVHAWDTDPRPWLALEYLDGGSLAERDDRSVSWGLWVGACVAAAVDHAHREGVAHLDLKPGNVLLRESPGDAWAVPKVADWGMARGLHAETVNLEGLSPRYAAPEQLAPDRFGGAGAATDVYQLGVVLYELLVGEAPFNGPPRLLRDAVLEEPPPPPSGRNPALPAEVDDLLDRALAKDPVDRYDSMAAFRRALERQFVARTGFDGDGVVPGAPDRDDAPSDADVAVEADPGAAGEPFERALALADEGFVRLSEGYFARRDPAPPLEAWRRGVTLVDARAGRAVERTVGDGADRASLTDRLLEGLADRTDHVVLGPPGSGKSTVCRQVACEWFDRGHGPVFYRESGRGEPFDRPDALARRASDADGHSLVVVEDAVRPEASAVFEFLDRVADSDRVTVLLDAREGEWRDAGRESDTFGADPVAAGREALEPVYVPRPDAREHERFVAAVEDATDRSLDVDVEELRGDVERAATGQDDGETRPGELFYLLHRLTALARDPLADVDAPTTLTDAVADVAGRLADVGETALDVGVCANACNAAGIGVHPELLYGVAPDDPLAVDEAIEVLDGRVVFPREADWSGGTRAYPAVHEEWSTAFLDHLLDREGEAAARERFGRVLERVLALADDADRRERVVGALNGDAPYLARIEDDPGAWADGTVEALYGLGREEPRLAPLFGDGEVDSIELPSACSGAVAEERPAWLGRTFEAGAYYDRAERAFERLSASGEHAVERLLGLARVGFERGDYERAAAVAEECLDLVEDADRPVATARAHRQLGRARTHLGDHETAQDHLERALERHESVGDVRGRARTLSALGTVVKRARGPGPAREYFERSLDLLREIGDRTGEVTALHDLGNVARNQGAIEDAREYLERSLEMARTLGDRGIEARALNTLGILAADSEGYERAREYFERSLSAARDIGARQIEADCLQNLAVVARMRNEYGRAAEHFEASLTVYREIGSKKGEAGSLASLGRVTLVLADLEAARDYYERAAEVAREVDDRDVEARALEGLSRVAARRAEYERAADLNERSLDIRRELDDPYGEGISIGNRGELALEQGEYERAREYFERSLERKRERPDNPGEANVINSLGVVSRRLEDLDEAERYHRQALEIAEDLGNTDEVAIARAGLGEVARERGRYDEAAEHFAAAAEALGGTADRFWSAKLELARARLALARGDVAGADERARTASDRFEELDAVHWVARGRRLLGRAAATAGDADVARDHLRAALETFEEVGAPQDALATLRHLVETCREVGEDDAADRWCDRAAELLASAPEPVADQHRDWVRTARDDA
jgi:tetratricopeptide (TPR) repeat protein